MISGTVSTVASIAFDSVIVGFKTILSGGNVTINGFMATGYTSQNGGDRTTAVTGYTKTKKHGILKAPNTYSPTQTSVIDSFVVS
jgi:hypothetical protein